MEYTDEYILRKEDLTAIADVIREKTSTTDPITVEQMPSKVNDVYEAGKQEWNNDFWQSMVKTYTSPTTYKERTGYNYAFFAWNDDVFYPTVKIYPTLATSMFNYFNQNRPPVNLKERLIESGGELDFSRCTGANGAFSYASVSVLPIIDLSVCTILNSMFNNCSVETIEKIRLKADGSQTFPNTFNACTNLKEIRFEGTIGTDGLNLQWSTLLDKESLTSIINCLSSTTTGLTVTLSLTAVNNAFEGGRDGEEWQNLISTKSNWTIAYA